MSALVSKVAHTFIIHFIVKAISKLQIRVCYFMIQPDCLDVLYLAVFKWISVFSPNLFVMTLNAHSTIDFPTFLRFHFQLFVFYIHLISLLFPSILPFPFPILIVVYFFEVQIIILLHLQLHVLSNAKLPTQGVLIVTATYVFLRIQSWRVIPCPTEQLDDQFL